VDARSRFDHRPDLGRLLRRGGRGGDDGGKQEVKHDQAYKIASDLRFILGEDELGFSEVR